MSVDATTARSSPAVDAASGISVVVATFRRLERLKACLDGIESQTRPADEVLVVTHADPQSESYVSDRAKDWRRLRLVEAGRARSVAAYNAGLHATTTAFVAYIDDDAVPAPDWLARIVATFAEDERIAAVGGRDVIFHEGQTQESDRPGPRLPKVGRIEPYGRMTGNHHVGTGPPQDVDVLKGVNMSFRRSAVRGHGFDDRLRGPGAVVHAELSICLPLRKQDLRIVYDPAIVVVHYPAPRPVGDHRTDVNARATFNSAHNEALQIVEYLSPGRRLAFAGWSFVIGNTGSPGLAVLARDLVRHKAGARSRFLAAQRGRAVAWRAVSQRRAVFADAPDRKTIPDGVVSGTAADGVSESRHEDGTIDSACLSISVVIATRDRPDLLARVVGQVLEQIVQGDELIVVDDSTASVDLRERLGDRVVVLRSGGRGPAVARNLGWRAAAGEVIVFTDDDVQIDPKWLAAIRAELGAKTALAGIEGQTVSRPFDPVYEYSVQSDHARNGLTCNVAYRRAVLERLGGFDENFRFAHCEDVDLFTRAKRFGEVQFAPSVIVDHEPRTIIPTSFTRRGGWLSSERRLYSKHPELRPYRLPPGLCALVDYVRWPIEVWLAHAASESDRDAARLRRSAQLAAMWWWHLAKAVPSLALTKP